jgi:hypothetical protein
MIVQEARTMAEERMQVLNMIREGKITAEEGARLLEALRGPEAGAGEAPQGSAQGSAPKGAGRARPGGLGDDPIGTIASTVAEMLQKSGLGGWRGGSWSNGPLQGLERRRQRESEGWELISLSEGDHGTFDVPAGARFAVETESGGISARAVESGPARLALEGDDLVNFAVYAARKGDEVVLSAYRTEHFARLPRLVIDVPAGIASLSERTSGGSLRATAFACPVTMRTSGGGIHVDEQGAGAVEARTSGGGIHVMGRPESVDLHTSGGGIHFRGQTGALQAVTSGGSVTLDGVRLAAGEHRAKTSGGSIRVRLTRDSSVDLSAQTSAGRLSIELPGIEGEQSGPRMSPRYRGKYNGGAARLELGTAAGSIQVGLAEEGEEVGEPGEGPAPSGEPSGGGSTQPDSREVI